MDLANTDRHTNLRESLSSSQSSRFHVADPTLLLFRTSMLHNTDNIRQTFDIGNNLRKTYATIPMTNLNSMKIYSVSDSEINYKFLEEIEEAQGSSAYINRSGTINFGVVLAGIHAVICKEHHLKVCELVMNILDVLLGLAVISSSEDDMHKKQLLTVGTTVTTTTTTTGERGDDQVEEWLKQIDAKEEEKFQLAVDITLR